MYWGLLNDQLQNRSNHYYNELKDEVKRMEYPKINLLETNSEPNITANNAPMVKRRKFPAKYCGLPSLIIFINMLILNSIVFFLLKLVLVKLKSHFSMYRKYKLIKITVVKIPVRLYIQKFVAVALLLGFLINSINPKLIGINEIAATILKSMIAGNKFV